MKHHNLTWFLHKPIDEREKDLYQRAQQAGFSTLTICLIFVLLGAWMFPTVSLNISVIGWMALLVLLLAYISGWFVLRDEDIKLDHPTPDKELRKQARNFWFALIAVAAMNILFVIAAPEYYFRFICSFGLFAYFYSFGTALRLSKQFPLPVRIALAIFLPIPTIVWVAMNTTSTFKKIAAMVGLTFATALSLIIMILALRQFVVSPFYLTTNAFAPEYTQGQYVLASYRQTHPTAEQYIIYDRLGDTMPVTFAQVIELTDATHYRVRVAVGEEVIAQDQIIGTILPTDSLFGWLSAGN